MPTLRQGDAQGLQARCWQAFKEVEASGLSGEEAVMAAFELNKNDCVRASSGESNGLKAQSALDIGR